MYANGEEKYVKNWPEKDGEGGKGRGGWTWDQLNSRKWKGREKKMGGKTNGKKGKDTTRAVDGGEKGWNRKRK